MRWGPSFFLGWMLIGATVAYGQQDEAASNGLADRWKFDRILLDSGKTIEGMVLDDDGETDLEFAEVRRLRGKPMNLVIRPIERRTIANLEKLSDAERAQLRVHLDKFIHRAAIEARRMEDIRLTATERDGTNYWQYHGNWFWLESTANETTTRRAAVRIEQVFTGYRQVLPPRRSPQRRLKIMLFGAETQYAAFLRGLGLEIANPAFFAADFNIVAAGSNANRFTQELEAAGKQHEAAKLKASDELAKLPGRLTMLTNQLRKSGIAEIERKAIVAAEQRVWQKQRQRLFDEIVQADRRNARLFDQVTGEMFARLYHEAFHAYLDNYVYPHQEFDVPRWLNEGLALTFEGGQVESETLRIDAPNRRALRTLQTDLQQPKPMSLAELLTANTDDFLPVHRGGEGTAARLYAYSWGLAYYLTFDESLLDSPKFTEYLTSGSLAESPIRRFEKLVGRPLAEFEPEWQKAMLRLR